MLVRQRRIYTPTPVLALPCVSLTRALWSAGVHKLGAERAAEGGAEQARAGCGGEGCGELERGGDARGRGRVVSVPAERDEAVEAHDEVHAGRPGRAVVRPSTSCSIIQSVHSLPHASKGPMQRPAWSSATDL